MKGQGPSTEQRSRYLLGFLSEEEREALEAQYFALDESFEGMLAAEEDLFDDYVSGRMSPAEREAFGQRYLSSREGRERLAFAQTLGAKAGRVVAEVEAAATPPDPRRRGAWVVLAAALAAALTAVWIARENVSLRTEVDRVRRERQAAAPPLEPAHSAVEPGSAGPAVGVPSPPPLPPEEAVSPPMTTLPVDLGVKDSRPTVDFRVSRGTPSDPLELVLHPATQYIRLEVVLPKDEDSPNFRIVIRTPDGRDAWRKEDLRPERPGDPLRVELPTAALKEAEYFLSVETGRPRETLSWAAPPVEVYRVHIIRKR